MTKKHFIAIAKELSAIADDAAKRTATEAFVRIARQTNPRFDVTRFYDAVGLTY